MYRHCAEEDPDIDVYDFIFEHLLNIQDGDNPEGQEKPHQPVFHHNPIQPLITFYFKIKLIHHHLSGDTLLSKKSYPATAHQYSLPGYLSEVFHPPSA